MKLREKIYPHFAKVFEAEGYATTEDYTNEKHMGDEVLSFASKHVIIRFWTDRGDLYSEIGAPPGKKFHDLEEFLTFMGFWKKRRDSQATPAELGRLFADHHDEIKRFFSDYANSGPKLLAYEDELRREFVKRFNAGRAFDIKP